MKTAGLAPLLLLLLSHLLIGTESNEQSESQADLPTSSPPADPGTSSPSSPAPSTQADSQVKNKSDPSGEEQSTKKLEATQTEPTINPKAPEIFSETKPTNPTATVTTEQVSATEKAPGPSASTYLTDRINPPDSEPKNKTNSADLPESSINSTEKPGKPQDTAPTVEGPKSSEVPKTMVATTDTPLPKPANPGDDKSKDSEGSEQQKGPTNTTETPKQDKKMLWILLPVLGVLVGGVIFVLKKYTKGHTHTDAADNGTENASFQSRSESNKDGVMLLGVKTSAGEENAAAR